MDLAGMQGTRMWPPGSGRGVVVVLLAGLFAVAATRTPFLDGLLFANSDLLLPPAFMHNLFASPATVLSFQLPRIPSVFPDLLAYGVLFAIMPTWQDATVAYAVVSFIALVLAGGAVAARLSGRRPGAGAGGFLAVAVLAILVAYGATGNGYTFTYVFLPVVHSGSFTVSLIGLLLAARGSAPPSRPKALLLAAMAAAATLSDRLFVGSFLLPLAAGLAASWLAAGRNRTEGMQALWIGGLAAFGCVLGVAADRLLFASVMLRQPDVTIEPGVQLAHLPALLHDPSVGAGAAMGVAAIALLPWRRWRDPGVAFWCTAGSVSVVAFLAALPLAYADSTSTRYVQPVWWWCIVAAAALLLRTVPRIVAVLELAMVGAFGVAVAGAWDTPRPTLQAAGSTPLASCLADLHGRGLVHAGLAGYWTARPLAASSGWTLQVEQIDGGGAPFPWGNNALYYKRDMADPRQPAVFDFLVMQDLDARAVRARFGEPGGTVPCPGGEVWLYPASPGLGPKLGMTGP